MKYCRIPGTDMDVSQIALGTWVFSGSAWGEAAERDCFEAVRAAIDHGITLIDTAPVYGWGEAEIRVGKALKGLRERVVLATKCGLVQNGKKIQIDLTPQSIRRELEASLRRLQTDVIDVYQCHWPDPQTPLEDTLKCLSELRDEGKIRHIGVSNFPLDLLKNAAAMGDFCRTLQSPLSLLDRELTREILPFCARTQMGVLAYGPLGGGILSGKYQEPRQFPKDDARSFFYKYYTGERFNKTRGFLDRLSKLGYPLNHLAVNWVRQQPGVTSVLVGCRNAHQAEENAAAAEWDLFAEDLAAIDASIKEWEFK